jgi:hypothetical protein
MEFSDLFVALARAAGIPAREVHGFAYTTNSRLQPLSLVTDVLHAWAEYYAESDNVWVAVDPTWGNTTRGVDYFSKFDFNHIAFAILGVESDYPYPAGSFKTATDTKDVYVNFLKEPLPSTPTTYTVSARIAKYPLLSLKSAGVVKITNTGSQLLLAKQITLGASYTLTSPNESVAVPPYGTVAIPFTLAGPLTFVPQTIPLTVVLDSRTTRTEIQVAPIYVSHWPVVALALILIFAIVRRYAFKRKN